MDDLLRAAQVEVEVGGVVVEEMPKCCHYWVIESPNGYNSRGVCKLCGEERIFNNSAERYLIKKRYAGQNNAKLLRI
ncbi:MAG: hypothetical protein Q7R57_09265 [Dehalococcoidales bacterium]|nr:hypothetical protein [Dehalococcoidales bacterium]